MPKYLNENHPDYAEYDRAFNQLVEKNLKERDEISKTGDRVAYALLVKKQAIETMELIKAYDRCFIYTDDEDNKE